MKKFYSKKNLPVEESPLTLQLQRRHTVVEGDKDNNATTVLTKLRPVARSNSTSSIYRPPKSAKDLSSHKGYLESTLSANSSGSSSASTVVITECQLSSSWLYNNKKAQMCSKEALSAGESSSQQASDNEEGRSPIIPRPKVNSVSSDRRSKKCSSCCCYVSIVIIAVLAALGIMSTVGGIIYMEFFSGSNKTQTPISDLSANGRHEDKSYLKKIGQSLDVGDNDSSQVLISSKEVSDSVFESKQEIKTLKHDEDSNNDKVNKQIKVSGNILRVKKVKDTAPNKEADVSITSIQTTNAPQSHEDSNKKRGIHQADLASSSKSDSPYSKLFELYKDMHTNLSRGSISEESSSIGQLNSSADKLNEKITDLTEEISKLVDNTSATDHRLDLEGEKHLRIFDTSFDSNDSSEESLKPDMELNSEESPEKVSPPVIPKYFFQMPSKDPGVVGIRHMFDSNEESDANDPQIPDLAQSSDENEDSKIWGKDQDPSADSKELFNSDNLKDSSVPTGEISGPAIPRNFFQIPPRGADVDFKNVFGVGEGSDTDNSDQFFPRFLPQIPEVSDQNDTSDGVVSNLDENNQESDLPHDLNRPVSETKIAVPGPLDLIRRFTAGSEPDNGESEEEKQDRRFFLAQALDRLRSLDVRNILPSSRQKTDSKKVAKQKFEPKVQNEQEVVTERSNYLQNLRRRFFEQ